MTLRSAVWLFPVVFVIHDSEEIFTMPAWIAEHQTVLARISESSRPAAHLIQGLPRTTAQVATAVLVELAIILIVTTAFGLWPERRLALYLYSAFLGVFSLHSVTHAAQAFFFHGYTPGVVSAALVIPPVSFYIYRRLMQSELLTWRAAASTAILGAVLFLPIVALAHLAGRALHDH